MEISTNARRKVATAAAVVALSVASIAASSCNSVVGDPNSLSRADMVQCLRGDEGVTGHGKEVSDPIEVEIACAASSVRGVNPLYTSRFKSDVYINLETIKRYSPALADSTISLLATVGNKTAVRPDVISAYVADLAEAGLTPTQTANLIRAMPYLAKAAIKTYERGVNQLFGENQAATMLKVGFIEALTNPDKVIADARALASSS